MPNADGGMLKLEPVPVATVRALQRDGQIRRQSKASLIHFSGKSLVGFGADKGQCVHGAPPQ
jgi:hypothetical protein